MSENESGSGGKLAIIGLFAVAVIGVFGFMLTRGGEKASKDAAGSAAASSSAKADAAGPKTQIPFLYSTEKKEWIERAVGEFTKQNPGIDVKLEGKGSLEAVQAILDGAAKPVVWSPADNVALTLLDDDWKQKHAKNIIAGSGDDKPEALVLTPLVFVAWEDRGKALETDGDKTVDIDWPRIEYAVSSPKGWAASLGGKKDWGFVKLGHTNPTKSNSGLQTLILMAYSFHNKRSGLEVGDVLDDKFQDFVKRVERGVPKFGDSTGSFMNDMVLYGPSKYDIVVVYENLAIQSIPNAQGRWGNLRIYYPKQTMWSSHPAAVLQADWVSVEQREAAHKLIKFLRTTEQQKLALQYGFRPADPSVGLKGADNPFEKATAFGVKLDLPSVVEPPPAPVIHNLMEMWSRIINR